MQEFFTPEVMGAHIDKLHALIAPSMASDPYMDLAKFQAGRDFMKEFVSKRRDFIQKELKRYAEQKPELVLEALDAREGWVELRNRGQVPVELGGKVLTTHLRRSIPGLLQPGNGPSAGVVLPERTLASGERVRFTAAELGLTFTPDGELGVFDGESVVGMKDVLFYGPLPDGKHYERAEDDGRWRVR